MSSRQNRDIKPDKSQKPRREAGRSEDKQGSKTQRNMVRRTLGPSAMLNKTSH